MARLHTTRMTPDRYPIRERRRLAKAELLMAIAAKAEDWAAEVANALAPREHRDDGYKFLRPFEEWGDDDPLVSMATRYGLDPHELARLLSGIGDELERRAERAGYAETWQDPNPPVSPL